MRERHKPAVMRKETRHCGQCALSTVFDFFELRFQSVETQVDGLLECVSCLRSEKFGCLGHGDSYTGLFVHGGFGLHYTQSHLYLSHSFVAAAHLVDFLVDEGYELIGDVEVDCFDFDFHSSDFIGLVIFNDGRVSDRRVARRPEAAESREIRPFTKITQNYDISDKHTDI